MRGLSLCLLAVLLTAVALFLGSTLPQVRFQPQADEGVYLVYASRVAKRGLDGLRGLFPIYAEHHEIARSGGPAPYRLTTVLLDTLAVRVGGIHFISLAVVSVVAFLGLLVVTFFGARELWGERTAWWTVLFLSSAPLHLGLARRALSDTLTSLFLAIGLWLLCAGVWGSGRRSTRIVWWVIPAAYGAAFLAKESGLLLIPISLSVLGWQAVRERRRPSFWKIGAVSWIPLCLAAVAVLFAAGGPKVLWETLEFFINGDSGTLYGQRMQSGPWYRPLVDLMLISPWPVLLYLLGLGVFSTDRKPNEKFWFWAIIPVVQILLMDLPPYGKNVRFLLLSEMAMRLCGVLVLQRLLGDRRGNVRSALWIGAVALAWVCTDLQAFHQLFVTGGIYDPVSYWLLLERGFIPR